MSGWDQRYDIETTQAHIDEMNAQPRSIEELIGWKLDSRRDRAVMWMMPNGMLTKKTRPDIADMLMWIVETFPDSNLAMTSHPDGKWNLIVEYADGSWKHTTSEHLVHAVENMIRQLTQEVEDD